MTDGQPTVGPTTLAGISPHMPTNIENHLIGFGTQHNETLLTGLVKNSNKGGEYYFIDDFEKAGMVYGTILDSIFHRFAKNIIIASENCEMYNYIDNIW